MKNSGIIVTKETIDLRNRQQPKTTEYAVVTREPIPHESIAYSPTYEGWRTAWGSKEIS